MCRDHQLRGPIDRVKAAHIVLIIGRAAPPVRIDARFTCRFDRCPEGVHDLARLLPHRAERGVNVHVQPSFLPRLAPRCTLQVLARLDQTLGDTKQGALKRCVAWMDEQDLDVRCAAPCDHTTGGNGAARYASPFRRATSEKNRPLAFTMRRCVG